MKVNFCTNCGKQQEVDGDFCPFCGTKKLQYQEREHEEQADVNNQVSPVEPPPQNQTVSSFQESPKQKKKLSKWLILPVAVIIGAVIFFIMQDSPHKSKVDGVSDEVYYQMVEQFFYMQKYYEILDEKDLPSFIEWMESQEQYVEAEAAMNEYEYITHAQQLFPNTLLIDYATNEERYSPTEQELIDKTEELYFSILRLNEDDFREISRELRSDLKIKDSYDPFKN